MVCPYNNLEAFERMVQQSNGELAAVIIEPVAGKMGCIPPQAGFLEGLRALCDREGIVLVHGDTASTLIGAILGKTAGLKVGHIESGLRSRRLLHPFPEEIIRLMTFLLSDLYFCADDWAVGNLRRLRGIKINTGGNTLLDAVRIACRG